MKRILFVLTVATRSTVAGAQQARSFNCRMGVSCGGRPSRNLAAVKSEYFPHIPTYTQIIPTEGNAAVSVIFKLFKDKLLLYVYLPAMTRNIEMSDIKFFIATFILDLYLRDWRFTFGHEYGAIHRGLVDKYFLRTIGQPSDRAARVTADGRN